MSAHRCHARECPATCEPEKLMCYEHWMMVPAALRARVRATFVVGQCAGLVTPTTAWCEAAEAAIQAVAELEGKVKRAPKPAHPLDGLLGISVHQPYAYLLAQGIKGVENRFRFPVDPSLLGRPLAIHATARIDPAGEKAALGALAARGIHLDPAVRPDQLARGSIVGVAVLTQAVEASDPERLAICAESDPWVEGPTLLYMEGATPLRPVPARGALDLWPVEGAVLDAVKLHFDALTTPRAAAGRARFVEVLDHWRGYLGGGPVPRLRPRVEHEAALAELSDTPPALSLSLPLPARPVATPAALTSGAADLVVVDTETANVRPTIRMVELALVRARRGEFVDRYATLIDPGIPIEPGPQRVHGITDAKVRGQPRAREVLERATPWLRGARVLAHNAPFDRRVLEGEFRRVGLEVPPMRWYCSLKASRALLKREPSYKIGDLARRFGVKVGDAHRAEDDARTALGVLVAIAAHLGVDIDRVIECGAQPTGAESCAEVEAAHG